MISVPPRPPTVPSALLLERFIANLAQIEGARFPQRDQDQKADAIETLKYTRIQYIVIVCARFAAIGAFDFSARCELKR